jgi:hypothetical protein
VTAGVMLTAVEDRKLEFKVVCRDEVDLICEGHHKRFVIDLDKFMKRVRKKQDQSQTIISILAFGEEGQRTSWVRKRVYRIRARGRRQQWRVKGESSAGGARKGVAQPNRKTRKRLPSEVMESSSSRIGVTIEWLCCLSSGDTLFIRHSWR